MTLFYCICRPIYRPVKQKVLQQNATLMQLCQRIDMTFQNIHLYQYNANLYISHFLCAELENTGVY